MTLPEIAAAASRRANGREPAVVSVAALERLLYGRRAGGTRVPAQRMRARSAHALLALGPDHSTAETSARLERAVGSMLARGWDEAAVGAVVASASPAARSALAVTETGARALSAEVAPIVRRALERYRMRSGRELGGDLPPEAVAVARSALAAVLPHATSPRARPAAVAILTDAGLAARQAAQVLGVSRRTVQRHVAARS
ncbi:hypothetical protein HNR08_003350 [Cellulomonas hominis]|nr:hypothetical protein [Cellulomonas hominis]MBB5474614.1 hypothetical protein [Cellulomonas hominis]